jgi:hypothetical protein
MKKNLKRKKLLIKVEKLRAHVYMGKRERERERERGEREGEKESQINKINNKKM